MASSASQNFVHLHLHTDYSLLDGACEIGELTAEAARRGMPAVAVTDHGNLFAAANFYHQATTHGVKPIIGCEVYVAPDNHKNRGRGGGAVESSCLAVRKRRRVSESYQAGFDRIPRRFLLQATRRPRFAGAAQQRTDRAIRVPSRRSGRRAAHRKIRQARTNAYRLRDIFGKGNFFLEIQDQGLEVETRDQSRSRRSFARNRDSAGGHERLPLPDAIRFPCAGSADVHPDRQDHERSQRMKFATDQFYFKTAEEMAQVFRELPDAVSRTVAIADRCNVKIQRVSNPFPEFKVPEGHTTDSYFERVAREGFAAIGAAIGAHGQGESLRHPLSEYESRLSAEIQMIQKMRFAGYFLIVWDFIRYARSQGIPVGPGRGSAAGSLVSFALQITDVDPLQYDLLFERFLNPERISMPDIDIDFCMRRRGEVIEYVRQTYGTGSVAQIITFGTMAAKAALKDVGRAIDMPYGEVDKIAKIDSQPH